MKKKKASSRKEYSTWYAMIYRCTNSKSYAYHRYGGRGISVCDRWENSFESFLEDMGLKPFPNAQIDRIDNDGNYEPSNCRWVTPVENSNNTSHNVFLENDGERLTIAQLSRKLGISKQAVHNRIKNGHPVNEVFMKKMPKEEKRDCSKPIDNSRLFECTSALKAKYRFHKRAADALGISEMYYTKIRNNKDVPSKKLERRIIDLAKG